MAHVRFMLVAAPAGSSFTWPGAWFEPGQAVRPTEPMWWAWRLLSANNRELGRSFTTFADVSSCVTGLEILRTNIAAAAVTTVPGLRTGLWHWEAAVDGVPRAISARTFRRRRDCDQNRDQFIVGATVAYVDFPAVTESAS